VTVSFEVVSVVRRGRGWTDLHVDGSATCNLNVATIFPASDFREDWFLEDLSWVGIHELLHALDPDWPEAWVQDAVRAVFRKPLNRAADMGIRGGHPVPTVGRKEGPPGPDRGPEAPRDS